MQLQLIEDTAKILGLSAGILVSSSLLVGGVRRFVKWIYCTAKYAEQVNDLIHKQLTPNGGESMYDMLKEVRAILREHDDRLKSLEKKGAA